MGKKIYHGTSEKYLESILANGLCPREKNPGNWHEAPSRQDRIYLTDTYAPFFADAACQKNERGLIVEVDLDMLYEDNLRPDEDFIAQVLQAQNKLPENMNIKQAAATIAVDGYAHEWEKSLKHLGNVAHVGKINKKVISRIALVRFDGPISFGGDPAITITHHRLVGDKTRSLIPWIFDGIQPDMEHISEETLQKELKKNPDDTMYQKILEGVVWRRKWFEEQRDAVVEIREFKKKECN